jgi:hypothetical protein
MRFKAHNKRFIELKIQSLQIRYYFFNSPGKKRCVNRFFLKISKENSQARLKNLKKGIFL